MKINYVYLYEHENKPLYVGIGSYTDPNADDDEKYKRARNIKSGHVDFHAWCNLALGGVNDITIKLVADGLTRKQARLVESSIIFVHSGDRALLNRSLSTDLNNGHRYVAHRRPRSRLLSGRKYYANPQDSAEDTQRWIDCCYQWNPWKPRWVSQVCDRCHSDECDPEGLCPKCETEEGHYCYMSAGCRNCMFPDYEAVPTKNKKEGYLKTTCRHCNLQRFCSCAECKEQRDKLRK
jgi:hypothetical protein